MALNRTQRLEGHLGFIDEPEMTFGYGQSLDDPRIGLFSFGPLEDRRPLGIRIGVVGTPSSISQYREWSGRFRSSIPVSNRESHSQFPFPGFESVFKSQWPAAPSLELAVSPAEISRCLRLEDRHVAVFETVSLFERPIRESLREDDHGIDIWFVLVPEEVFLLGRPLSRLRKDERISLDTQMNARLAKRLLREPSLFEDDMRIADTYRYEVNFHHQLKARLLDLRAVAQIIREPSIAKDGIDSISGVRRRMQDPASIAWNLATASFFKAGGRPWKLASVRDGVCYVGLVFKRLSFESDSNNACCGAQMFLGSGEGLVFKGAVGPWYSPTTKECHLSSGEACKVAQMVVKSYVENVGKQPRELFIHGRSRFTEEEWNGFRHGAGAGTSVSCITIKRSNELKLFREGTRPTLRGTTLQVSSHRGYLWTTGYIPQMKTYPGREVPNPLSIEMGYGTADLQQVLADIQGLTKLNFNACIYADGLPVTLRFANAVGEILTACPLDDLPPLPFRHYI
jgi:hypothetical protein